MEMAPRRQALCCRSTSAPSGASSRSTSAAGASRTGPRGAERSVALEVLVTVRCPFAIGQRKVEFVVQAERPVVEVAGTDDNPTRQTPGE
jgi:hypothetical protein